MYVRIQVGPAEKHMRPGKVKLTVTESSLLGRESSTSVYLPKELIGMMSAILDNYSRNEVTAFAVMELDDDEDE